MTIWKYKIQEVFGQPVITEFEMPKGAAILSCGLDPAGDICVWARVNEHKEETVIVKIIPIGTGWGLPDNFNDEMSFIGTVTKEPFVWHLFEVNGRVSV